MSEQQKVFASLSGAFVAHVLLLFLVFLLLSTNVANSSLTGGSKAEPEVPQEVTILMSDLMEQITTVAPAPEARPFISTDLNRPESQAPENARFESDRNTTAASELQPDKMLPGERVPTLEGDNPLPNLTLQNREFVEGRLNELPSEVPAPSEEAEPGALRDVSGAMPSGSGSATESTHGSLPAKDVGNGMDREALEGSAEPRKERPDERKRIPKGLDGMAENPSVDRTGEAPEHSAQRSFIDPNGDSEFTVSGQMSAERDGNAAPRGEANGGTEAINAEQENVAEVTKPTSDQVTPGTRTNEPTGLKSADDGLFSSGFSPEERKNVINGSLDRIGQNAVDAEETALGRYKKSVRDAISSTWHRYRQDNAEFVTWGILKLEFTVDAKGGVKNLHITKNEANAILAEFSLKAIREAKLPPMPEDVAKSVGSQGLVIQYDIIIY